LFMAAGLPEKYTRHQSSTVKDGHPMTPFSYAEPLRSSGS
jgi:hypothetical protein